jgi:hypothetical protein
LVPDQSRKGYWTIIAAQIFNISMFNKTQWKCVAYWLLKVTDSTHLLICNLKISGEHFAPQIFWRAAVTSQIKKFICYLYFGNTDHLSLIRLVSKFETNLLWLTLSPGWPLSKTNIIKMVPTMEGDKTEMLPWLQILVAWSKDRASRRDDNIC